MANTFFLEIVTPERSFLSENVEMVIVKTPQGELGILAGHIPMVTNVAVGPVQIKKDGKFLEAVMTEGFMEVTQEKTVILVDTAEWPEEIDEKRAEEAMLRAEERLHSHISHMEYTRSQAALARAMTRLKVKKQIR